MPEKGNNRYCSRSRIVVGDAADWSIEAEVHSEPLTCARDDAQYGRLNLQALCTVSVFGNVFD